MAGARQIRDALAAALQQLPGCQVLAYPPAQPQYPCIYVLGPEIDYDRALHRGVDEWTFTIQALCSLATVEGGTFRMDEFMESSGPGSVKAVLEQDTTLGGAVDDLRVTRGRADQIATIPGTQVQVVVGEWTVTVISEGA